MNILQNSRRGTLLLSTAVITGMLMQPAISLPLSMSATGLPIGTQFVSGTGREDILSRLSSQLEQALPWADRHPKTSLWNDTYIGKSV